MFQGIIENIDTVTDLATVRIQCVRKTAASVKDDYLTKITSYWFL
jgi:hypothetical protein